MLGLALGLIWWSSQHDASAVSLMCRSLPSWLQAESHHRSGLKLLADAWMLLPAQMEMRPETSRLILNLMRKGAADEAFSAAVLHCLACAGVPSCTCDRHA